MLSIVIKIIVSFLLYSFAVLDGRRRGLKLEHLLAFLGGFIFDLLGTVEMFGIAGGFKYNLHGFLGIFALSGMGFHAILALLAAIYGQAPIQFVFHRISIWIYLTWCLAFFSGIIIAIFF